jgi:glycerate 2-kinase
VNEDARPRGSLDAPIKVAAAAGYEILDLGADLEGEARNIAADHARLALKARAGPPGRYPLRS